jgi:hypothetical protein
MSDDQLEQRIRASLARRAGSVQVEPDLAGLAKGTEPPRVRTRRFPLVAVAVVLTALAVTSVALGEGHRESNVMLRSGHRADRAEDPTTTTHGPASTSAPKGSNRQKRPAATTTVPVPTTVPPPGPTTPPTLPGGAPDDGTGATPEPDPVEAAPPCAEVEGDVVASTSWEGDSLLVVQYGGNATFRHLTIWRDPAGPDACPRRLQDTAGQTFGFSLPTQGGSPSESHTIRCSPPRFEFLTGYTDDGVTWRFGFETYAVEGDTVSLVDERSAQYVEPADHDVLQSLLLTDCGVLRSDG